MLMAQTSREPFAQWLRDQLRSQGWMVSDFAQQVGVRPSAVYRWTAGQRTPTDSQVDKIAEALKLPSSAVWDELARSGITPIGPVTSSRKEAPRPTTPPNPPIAPEDRPFGKWLRAQLEERGWSAGFLARKMGLDVVTVRAWATGLRNPASVQLPGIAAAFETDEDTVRAALSNPS